MSCIATDCSALNYNIAMVCDLSVLEIISRLPRTNSLWARLNNVELASPAIFGPLCDWDYLGWTKDMSKSK